MVDVNINQFMDRFHALEVRLNLFESLVDGERWWDSVRYDVSLFLFGCLTDVSYTSLHQPPPRPRTLGRLRRWGYRQALFAASLVQPKDFVVIRAARNLINGRRRDIALDPMVDLFLSRCRVIDTIPRYYHLPDFDYTRPAKVPTDLTDLVRMLVAEFGIDAGRTEQVERLVRRRRIEYAHQVDGYYHLFSRVPPKAVLLVQNGIEKALFHVANQLGVPAIEAQHGLISHGHPAYSYPRGVDYARQTAMPGLFLTFSKFWSDSVHYPAARTEVIGTDHFGADIPPLTNPLGTIMVISADIYHQDLLAETRRLAALLPDRQFLYKLHPNQALGQPDIIRALADLPNVTVGDARISAARLMHDVSHLVAIQSTVVYEALQNGRGICLFGRHDYHIHSDVFAMPGVSVAETTADIAAAVARPGPGAAGPVFFEKFDPSRASAILTECLKAGRSEVARQ